MQRALKFDFSKWIKKKRKPDLVKLVKLVWIDH